MNFFKNLFGNKKVAKEEKSEEPKAEEKTMGCDCSCCESAGCCPGEEMKKAVAESEEEK